MSGNGDMTVDERVKLGVMEAQLSHVINQNKTIVDDLQRMRELLERMVRIEERSSDNAAALEKAQASIESIGDTVTALDKRVSNNLSWLGGAVAVGTVLIAVIGWVWNTRYEHLPNRLDALTEEVRKVQVEQSTMRRTWDNYTRQAAKDALTAQEHGQ